MQRGKYYRLFTKFEMVADILPLFRLNKRRLLKNLGADPALYEKIPTADLEEENQVLLMK